MAYPTTQKSYPSRCIDWMAFSLFWKITSMKSWREVPKTEVPRLAPFPDGELWIELTLKTPGMLK